MGAKSFLAYKLEDNDCLCLVKMILTRIANIRHKNFKFYYKLIFLEGLCRKTLRIWNPLQVEFVLDRSLDKFIHCDKGKVSADTSVLVYLVVVVV